MELQDLFDMGRASRVDCPQISSADMASMFIVAAWPDSVAAFDMIAAGPSFTNRGIMPPNRTPG